jgi:protein transport protein SEC24
MDKKNIVKTPFGMPKDNIPQNEIKTPNENTTRPPPFIRNQTSTNIEDKTTNRAINQGQKLPPSNVMNESVGQNYNKEAEDIAKKEYESLKKFNCSKNFLRLTTDKLPANSVLLKDAAFPVGMIINPFCYQEGDLPNVNYGEKEIPRCFSSQCRAYINPFVKWIEGGEKWVCNICKYINTTEDYYYAKLDKYGYRVDRNEKPDLCLGSYEFVANRTYMKKDKLPNHPVFIFIIDVSLVSSQNGFLSAVLESIKDTINTDVIPHPDRTKIAFITYDSSIHFYCLSNKLTQPQMLCVSDENVFLPSTIDSLLVPLDKSKKIALTALDLIQTSFTNNTCKDSHKIFTAINAGYLLAKNTGGKMIIFNASLSMTQLPKMKSSGVVNIPKDELVYTPTDEKQLSTMGINLTNENISCDMFIASESYVVNNILIL